MVTNRMVAHGSAGCAVIKSHSPSTATTDPEIVSYDPGRDDPGDALLKLDLEDSLRRFAQDRARLVGRLRTLAPADWERTARHDGSV